MQYVKKCTAGSSFIEIPAMAKMYVTNILQHQNSKILNMDWEMFLACYMILFLIDKM